MNRILTSLKDIQGVVGSFVLNGHGSLMGREMPALYPDELFPEIGRRLESVKEALETQKGPCSELLLKFDAYWLLSRKTTKGTLNILTTESVNYPALRMATNVALKQIEERLTHDPEPLPVTAAPVAAPVLPLAPEAVAVPVVAAPAVAAAAAKPRRMWRGQLVD